MFRASVWRRLVAAFASGLVASAAAAADPQQSHVCASVVEADARLACYDQAFPPVVGAQSEMGDLDARRSQAVADFGLNPKQLIERSPDLREIEHDRIEVTIEGVLERPGGQRVITLENDQVWLLIEGTSRGRLKAGDRVTIRKAALGSYMLVTGSGVALRARRLN